MSTDLNNFNYAKAHAGKAYRADIDGLRALAVLSVVIYHLKPDALPGGFIGVDIFFVISGYLITGIVAHKLEAHRFSLLDFYQRRIRRIFPALSLVLVFGLLVGWFFLFPSEYASLGKHVAAGAGFVQNLALWSESGYFDRDAILKPLLHLWSLAVEEQFYIFWPFALWVILKKRLPIMSTVAVIACLSFALNIYYIWQGNTESAFYLPFARAWELMAGAWLVLAHRRGMHAPAKWANHLSWGGLVLVVAGLALINSDSAFPGLWALMPVLGTVLMIHAGPTASLNQRWLAAKPVVWIGLISYPLYLWHWILWSLGSIIFYSALDHSHTTLRVLRGVVLVLSFLFAWLTYRWLEAPVRQHARPATTWALALAVALLGTLGLAIHLAKGIPDRPGRLFDPAAEKLASSVVFSPLKDVCHNLVKNNQGGGRFSCFLGEVGAKQTMVVYGDSHAMALLPAFEQYGKDRGVQIVFASQDACLPLSGVRVSDDAASCAAMVRKMVSLASTTNAFLAVLVAHWSVYQSDQVGHVPFATGEEGKELFGSSALKVGLRATLEKYKSMRIPIVFIEDNPRQVTKLRLDGFIRFSGAAYFNLMNRESVSLAEHKSFQAKVNEIIEDEVSGYRQASVFNTDVALCRESVCPWVRNGKILYHDEDHLSVAGAMEIYPLLKRYLDGRIR